MKQKATHRVLRGVLIAAVFVISLVTGGLHESRHVGAVDCDTAFQNYLNADGTYEIARLSYFYDVPSSCGQRCPTITGSATSGCVDECTNRHTTFGQAEIGMFNLALDTCTPLTIDQCSQARGMVDACLAQWQWESQTYTDQEELSAAASRYMACREASKIDSCQ